jgi:hypothetical protein
LNSFFFFWQRFSCHSFAWAGLLSMIS